MTVGMLEATPESFGEDDEDEETFVTPEGSPLL